MHRVRAVLRLQQLAALALCALLVAGNWLLFIWSVNNNHLLEAKRWLLSPLCNILLGMLFLGERLRHLQWLALLLACAGVVIQILLLGHLPWIALTLAITFSIYGLIRKQLPVDAPTGLFIETSLLLPLALIYLIGVADSASSHLLKSNPQPQCAADAGRW